MMKLVNPKLKLLFYKDFYEKSLLSYELKGMEKEGKGPIIIAVDNSGSMSGNREIWSKAIALTLLDIAIKQKRNFVLYHFNTRVTFTYEKIKNDSVDIENLFSAMEHFSSGGTSFKQVLDSALNKMEQDEFKKADVILITDGEADDHDAKMYKEKAHRLKTTTYGIVIGNKDSARQCVEKFCDSTYTLNDLTQDSTITSNIFSI
jgi:uncharacterized protein with von Willebrand factor type A (vWA) domain